MRTLLKFLLICLFPIASSQAQTVVNVSPSDPAGWAIGPFGTPPTADFTLGPGMPPAGTGSYACQIAVPNSKVILARLDYHDLPLSELTAFSFSTWRDTAATNNNNWYVNFYVDADGDGSADERLDWVPPNNTAADTWETFDLFAGDGTLTSNMGFNGTIQAFMAANPNARFNAFDLPDGGAVRLNMGDTAASYVGYSGAIDNLRITHTSVGDFLYDFELQGIPLVIPTLSLSGMVIMIILMMGLMLFVGRPFSE